MGPDEIIKPNELLKRSIDTLQRLYAVIAALAVGEVLRRTFLSGGGQAHSVQISWPNVPLCIALLVTIVPFVHGMNRHLDDHIDSLNGKNRGRMIFTLVIDFFVFVFECCLIFVLGAAVDGPCLTFCKLLSCLLGADMLWAVLRMFLEKDENPHDSGHQELWWAVINFVAAGFILYLSGLLVSDLLVRWLLATVAILRTLADYGFGRDHYFPRT